MTNVKDGGSTGTRQAVVEELVLDLRQFVIGLLVANLEAAEAVGLNPSDLGCLCLLLLHGPSPAGRLATLTGLTTGAITGVIDQPDEAKVEKELLPRFAQLNRATRPDFYKGYNEEELAAIGDFLARLIG